MSRDMRHRILYGVGQNDRDVRPPWNSRGGKPMIGPLQTFKDAQTLAQAIVNTIAEPFIVLDDGFRVISASRSFYKSFQVEPEQTLGHLLYALGDGQWDIPALRLLLETIIPERVAMDDFEVEHDFPQLGRRTMLLNARKVVYDDSSTVNILLAFTDVTLRRAIEREKEDLLKQTEDLLLQQQILLQEMEHRVANSLQLIASILLLKARTVTSEETRLHLRDAHHRVMSVAAVQQHLHSSEAVQEVEVASYLSKLCESLAASMVGEDESTIVKVISDTGGIPSAKAVSLGLIVTELVINAIKYAFPVARPDARIHVTYEIDKADWKLIVSDNGIGSPGTGWETPAGLGTAIVAALVSQLDARMDVAIGRSGRSISITRATFTSRMPQAA